MIQACSHLVISAESVENMKAFFSTLFSVSPHFSNSEFCEFVLPSRFRIAFFKPIGKAAQFFSLPKERSQVSYGVTVKNVEQTYQKALEMKLNLSGPPKDHPWGEKSFLVIDVENNRWEITQSPSEDGLLVDIK
ncbi:MAG: VOC family protein [Bdellovibrionales bacterium]|nr:VOC family protein [Bdellovibrionales bacterium]